MSFYSLLIWKKTLTERPQNQITVELSSFKTTHPPAAAAWRQVLPNLSGVSISKPADSTCSLLNKDTMLYFCPS